MISQSKKTNISAPVEKIFNSISSFNNFGSILPDQVKDWRSTDTECFFKIEGLTEMGLLMNSKNPFTNISIVNHPDVSLPLSFTLNINFTSISEDTTEVQAIMDVDVNPMMGMMLKKPLDIFVNTLVEKLKEKAESNES